MAKNGRVIFPEPDTNKLFSMYDQISCNSNPTEYRNALTGNWIENPVSCKYFSKENILFLQDSLVQQVYLKSNQQYKIGHQCSDTLKIIMRSIYLTNAKNQHKHIDVQVTDLNNLVLEYAVNQIIGEATGYIKYINDITTLPVPNDLPITDNNNDGTKFTLDQRDKIGF